MGEYAKYAGQKVKIGTCENMYYLRADQRHKVTAVPNSLDPARDAELVRFRFPFPDEDHLLPGQFENYWRKVPTEAPACYEEVEHKVPRGQDACRYGKAEIVQQRLRGDVLMLVCQCSECGCLWRYETWRDAMVVVNALQGMVREWTHDGDKEMARFFQSCALRILEGYDSGARPKLRLVNVPAPITEAPKETPANDAPSPNPEIPTDPRAIIVTDPKDRDSKRFGKVYAGETLKGTTVEIVPGKSIVIRKLVSDRGDYVNVDGKSVWKPRPPETVVRKFKIGDVAEVGSYNLVYTGNVRKITDKTITCVEYEDNPGLAKTYRFSIYRFVRMNWDFDLAEACKRNADWRD